MSFVFLVFIGFCFTVCTAVIHIDCPPDCVCHDTVWRCSSRRVTTWPLDNQEHIIIRGVTTLDMSKSNINVLPNWPPTHNFPDLKMVMLADTAFDDDLRCRELECLQKLNLLVLSSCPANLRQGCAHAPCCYWSAVTTTRLPSSTIPTILNLSTNPTTIRLQLTTNRDPRNGVTEQTYETRAKQKETLISVISTPVYNTTTYRQDDERVFVADQQSTKVTTEYILRAYATTVVPESVSHLEYFRVTAQNVIPTQDFERNVQAYSAVHELTVGITGQWASSSAVGIVTGEESVSGYQAPTTEDDLTAGHDERAFYLQPTVSHPRVTNRVEYVGIFERVVKPLQRKLPITPVLKPEGPAHGGMQSGGPPVLFAQK